MSETGQQDPTAANRVAESIFTSDFAQSATDLFVASLLQAVHERGEFIVALSGGTTPLALYRKLAALPRLPWEHVRVFWGDERFVSHSHSDSNYHGATESLLKHVPIPAGRIHPWPEPHEGFGLDDAAAEYARTLGRLLGPDPLFDLQLLGLGADAHTASLYPNDPAIHEPTLTASASPANILHPRLTLTPRALSNSRTVAFLVSGEHKRQALADTLTSAEPAPAYPARYVGALEKRILLTDLTV